MFCNILWSCFSYNINLPLITSKLTFSAVQIISFTTRKEAILDNCPNHFHYLYANDRVKSVIQNFLCAHSLVVILSVLLAATPYAGAAAVVREFYRQMVTHDSRGLSSAHPHAGLKGRLQQMALHLGGILQIMKN